MKRFNPYDLNDVADIDEFIRERNNQALLDSLPKADPPTVGILRPLTDEEKGTGTKSDPKLQSPNVKEAEA